MPTQTRSDRESPLPEGVFLCKWRKLTCREGRAVLCNQIKSTAEEEVIRFFPEKFKHDNGHIIIKDATVPGFRETAATIFIYSKTGNGRAIFEPPKS